MKLGVQKLAVSKIDETESVQAREQCDPDVITAYAASMHDGDEFPPIDVFFDGTTYRIADGHHRYGAVLSVNGEEILATVHEGGRFEAVLFAVGANAAHGLQRSNRDKRAAVALLIAEPGVSDWQDRKIARACGVSHPFVASIRRPGAGNRCQSTSAPAGNRYQATGNESGPLPTSGNRAASLPTWQPAGSAASDSPPSSIAPPTIDAEQHEARRLEERIERLVTDLRETSPRVRRLVRPALDLALGQLTRMTRETAA